MKEIPVSDANPGDDSPPRPGMNAKHVPKTGGSTGGDGHKDNSASQRTQRGKQAETGIQANNTSKTSSNGEGQTRSSEDPLTSKRSKRRRRRRGRRKGNRPELANPNGAVNASSNQQSENRGENTDHGSRAPEKQDGAAPAVKTSSTGADSDNLRPASSDVPDGSRRRKRRRSRRPGAKKRESDSIALEPQRQQAPITPSNKNKTKHPNAKPRLRPSNDAYAALDLGTNNCRLLVAVPQQPGRFRVIDAFSRIVRLGEGLAATGLLKKEAMDRAVGALKVCAGKLENREVRGVRLIATEACRRALNGEEFLQRVEREAGLKLEIVDRETEARLAVAGCASLIDRQAKGVVLFDIGGGSSELALLDLRNRKGFDVSNAMRSWTSLPLGVVTLSEKHGGGKLVTREVFNHMVAEVSELLESFEGRDALKEAGQEGEIHLLGTSGTVTTLAGIHLKLPRYNRRQVDGVWMASKDVENMIEALIDMSFEQRVENPCIGHDRADLVLAGCAILVAIQRLWPCPRLRVADRGLREGLLTEMMNTDNAWQRRPRHFGKRR